MTTVFARQAVLALVVGALAGASPAAGWAQQKDSVPQPARERERAAARAEAAARTRGWVGISFETLTTPAGAVRVQDVFPNSPAARVGLQKGDTLLSVNGRPAGELSTRRLTPGDTLRLRMRKGGREVERTLVAERRPLQSGERPRTVYVPSAGLRELIVVDGDSIRIRVDSLRIHADSLHRQLERLWADSLQRRYGELQQFWTDSVQRKFERLRADELRDLEIVRRRGAPPVVIVDGDTVRVPAVRPVPGVRFAPAEAPAFGLRGAAGAEFAELNPQLAEYFRGARQGVLVLKVSPQTPAARAGLRAGDVVVRAGGTPVTSVRELRRALTGARAKELPLEVVRKGQTQRLTLRWER